VPSRPFKFPKFCESASVAGLLLKWHWVIMFNHLISTKPPLIKRWRGNAKKKYETVNYKLADTALEKVREPSLNTNNNMVL
jgi:hypothetical protein